MIDELVKLANASIDSINGVTRAQAARFLLIAIVAILERLDPELLAQTLHEITPRTH